MDVRAKDDCRPLARVLLVFGAWALLVAAGPGALTQDGSPWLAVLAFWAWSHAASRPGRFAFWIEWLAGSLGLGITLFWIAYVFAVALPPAAIGMGLYAAGSGWALRRLCSGARWRLPLPVAAPIAWVTFETLRDLLEPPFGMGWLRVGHLASAHEFWLAGARVVGVEGLSFTIVALGAGVSVALRERRPAPLALGGAPFLLAVIGGQVFGAPELEPGPRFLLVQPNFSVDQKQGQLDWRGRLDRQIELTQKGLAQAGPVDAVCWPETSSPASVAGPGVVEAVEAGVGFAPWLNHSANPRQLLRLREIEQIYLEGEVLGAIPESTAFLSGAEEWVVHDGIFRRRNILALWQRVAGADEPVIRRELGAKQKLAPGGETVLGLDRFEMVRDWIFDMAGYLPDFLAGEKSSVLGLERAGKSPVRVGATICFDNAYQGPYLDTVRREPVDLFVMVSNEAWYHGSWELDQMVAFSKVLAVASGRSLIRCTNTGITTVLDPRGRRVDTLLVEGRDRDVAGTLAVTVPVPKPRDQPPPPYARWFAPWRWGLVALGAALAILAGRRPLMPAFGALRPEFDR